jgi:hypothetical protein
MVGRKTIPIRGMKQDWYGDNEQKILENNKEYARMSMNNNLFGSPDFENFRSFLVKSDNKNLRKYGQDTGKDDRQYEDTLHKKETRKK